MPPYCVCCSSKQLLYIFYIIVTTHSQSLVLLSLVINRLKTEKKHIIFIKAPIVKVFTGDVYLTFIKGDMCQLFARASQFSGQRKHKKAVCYLDFVLREEKKKWMVQEWPFIAAISNNKY